MSLRPKKGKRRRVNQKPKHEQGKYYSGKGYYLDGEFLTHSDLGYGVPTSNWKKAYKLGQIHVERHRKSVSEKAFTIHCKYWARHKAKSPYDKGQIDACKEYLVRTGEENNGNTIKT